MEPAGVGWGPARPTPTALLSATAWWQRSGVLHTCVQGPNAHLLRRAADELRFLTLLKQRGGLRPGLSMEGAVGSGEQGAGSQAGAPPGGEGQRSLLARSRKVPALHPACHGAGSVYLTRSGRGGYIHGRATGTGQSILSRRGQHLASAPRRRVGCSVKGR